MFMSRSTTPAAESGVPRPNAFITVQTANSWSAQPASWQRMAAAAGPAPAEREALTCHHEEAADAAHVVERRHALVAVPRREHRDREQREPDEPEEDRGS